MDSTIVPQSAVQNIQWPLTADGNNRVQYITVQYSTIQYITVQYSAIQYITVQYSWKIAGFHRRRVREGEREI